MKHTVDIYLFVYHNKSDKCMSFLSVLDYPPELINVTVFSDRKIKHTFKHIEMSEEDAYRDIRHHSRADYIWIINADTLIQSTQILKDLIATGLPVCSGLLTKTNSTFANFWGALSPTGWYERSENYLPIVERTQVGAFKVPYITGNILFKRDHFVPYNNLTMSHDNWDLDMNICHNLRTNGEDLYIINKEVYGHIDDSVDVYENLGPWRDGNYLAPEFVEFLGQFEKTRNIETKIFKELGPDIWQFPLFKPEFCDYLIELAESKNEWSGGIYAKKNEIDPRIGAVENFPTQDVHLRQIGLHDWWLNKVVETYFKAVLSYLYRYQAKGYNISFIVKYTTQGQTKLDPHHDSSAYTTNIALNTHGTDYTGGGCHFLHKKVECVGNIKGHVIMHPGRITHFHEAYPVESGTRYILVSFNN